MGEPSRKGTAANQALRIAIQGFFTLSG